MKNERKFSSYFSFLAPLKLFSGISLGVAQLLGLAIAISILFTKLPEIFEIVAAYDVSFFAQYIHLITEVFLFLFIATFVGVIGVLLFALWSMLEINVRSFLISYKARQLAKVAEEQEFLEKQIDVVFERGSELKREINYIKSSTHETKRNLRKFRIGVRKVIKQLERDLNYLTDFILNQFRDNTAEMFAFLQVAISSTISEVLNLSPFSNILNLLSAGAIFWLATLIKNPRIDYARKIGILIFLEINVVWAITISANQINAVAASIYFAISLVISFSLGYKIYQQRNRLWPRVNLAKHSL